MDHEVDPIEYNLKIGGINLTFSWLIEADPGTLHQHYLQFLNNKPNPYQPTLDIQVLEGDPPVKPNRAVFNSDYWTMHDCGNDHYLIRFSGMNTYSLVVNRDFCTAQLYINLKRAEKLPKELSLICMIQAPVDQLLLMHALINNNGMIVHSAGGSFHGQGFILPAVSGGGKSTVSRLLSKGSQNRLYSDDRMIIRLVEQQWYLYGTPWHGDEAIAVNEKIPLNALVFLTQADRTEIRPLPVEKALKILMRVCSIPLYDEIRVQQSLDICESLLQAVPTYELLFTRDESVMPVIDDFSLEL